MADFGTETRPMFLVTLPEVSTASDTSRFPWSSMAIRTPLSQRPSVNLNWYGRDMRSIGLDIAMQWDNN